jgi:transposase InsO family protein
VGRKIAASLRRQGPVAIRRLDHHRDPAPSWPADWWQPVQKAWKRFEHAKPNALWQMDFKGDVAFARGPVASTDRCRRSTPDMPWCFGRANERRLTVQNAVQAAFEHYGLPDVILADNGSPWGDSGAQKLTKFDVWLIEHGVAPWHSPPSHPQSHGKNERFNRTLNDELLEGRTFDNLDHAQQAFDAWRHRYNYHRPHDALGLAVPADRYQPSSRSFSPIVRSFDYDHRRRHSPSRRQRPHSFSRPTPQGLEGVGR